MGYRNPISEIAIANAGGTINVDVTEYVGLYTVSPATTGILTGSTTIAPTGTDTPGVQYLFDLKGGITLGAFSVTVFGYSLTAVQADKGCIILAYYNGSTYDIKLFVDHSQLAVVESDRLVGDIPLSKLAIDARLTTNTTNIASTGGTTNFAVSTADRYQIITGTGTLTGSVTIATTGTPIDGYTFLVDYRATFDIDVFGVSILGEVLNASAALSGGVLVLGVYDATAAAFRVRVLMDSQAVDVIISDNIANLDGAKIDAGSISASKMAAGNTTDLYTEFVNANVANVVTGDNAFGIGEDNTVSGNNAVALGESNVASGANSFAVGRDNTASGARSVSIGNDNSATAQNAIAMGANNTASLLYAMAIGNLNTASGSTSIAIGSANTASGASSVAMGGSNFATGDTSVAMGAQNTASGTFALAFGNNAISARYAQLAVSSGSHSGNATEFAQATIINAFRTTTDATPSLLFLDAIAENISVATNSVVNFKGYLTAVQDAGSAGTVGDVSTWQFDGAIKNIGGVTALLTSGVYFDAQQARVAKETDTAAAGGAATITLGATGSTVNNIYNLARIYIISGTGAGQVAQILSYVGSTKVATVTANWATPPDNTSVYRIVTQRNYDAAALPWDVTITANNTNDALDVTVTGETNKTIYWHLTLVCDEIKFA
jgi:hypothetical protein